MGAVHGDGSRQIEDVENKDHQEGPSPAAAADCRRRCGHEITVTLYTRGPRTKPAANATVIMKSLCTLPHSPGRHSQPTRHRRTGEHRHTTATRHRSHQPARPGARNSQWETSARALPTPHRESAHYIWPAAIFVYCAIFRCRICSIGPMTRLKVFRSSDRTDRGPSALTVACLGFDVSNAISPK